MRILEGMLQIRSLGQFRAWVQGLGYFAGVAFGGFCFGVEA